ncbi:N-acetylmuramoyl-L-alanine amidase [Candidatus Zixiibacteriota bacterium]
MTERKTFSSIWMGAAAAAVLASVMIMPYTVDAQGNRDIPRQLQEGEESASGVPVAVIARNGAPTQERLRGIYMEGGELYLKLYDLGVYLGATDRRDVKNKYVLTIEGRELRFTIGSPVVVVDNQPNQAVNLPHSVVLHRGDFYAPASGVASILTRFTGRNCEYIQEQEWLNYGGSGLNVLGITITHRDNQGTEVEIHTTEPILYEHFSEAEGWLYITMTGARADVAALKRTRGVGLVNRVEVTELRDDVLQIGFRLSRRYSEVPDFYPSDNAIFFVLRNAAAGERVDASSDRMAPPRLGGIQTVIIDPGHGGKDPGSVGATGLLEKDVVLDIALRLRELLQQDPRTADITVIMTREDDTFPTLPDRFTRANQGKGDLFISIHTNSWHDPSVSGFMTFFLAEAKNDEARQMAQLENSVLKYEDTNPALSIDAGEPMLAGILGELISTKYLEESQVLAAYVQDELTGRIRHQVRPRFVDQAPFLVLNGASMPSVLVETAFISNRAEENFLRQNSFKNRVAEALHEAIIAYRDRVKVPPN